MILNLARWLGWALVRPLEGWLVLRPRGTLERRKREETYQGCGLIVVLFAGAVLLGQVIAGIAARCTGS